MMYSRTLFHSIHRNTLKGTTRFVSLQTNVVIEECIVMINSEEFVGTTEYLTVYTIVM
jgi:hypothetical protein